VRPIKGRTHPLPYATSRSVSDACFQRLDIQDFSMPVSSVAVAWG
jgi:hypothetical protein